MLFVRGEACEGSFEDAQPFQEDGYAAYRAALEKLFDAYCQDGTVAYPYITRCYAGRLYTADTNDKS